MVRFTGLASASSGASPANDSASSGEDAASRSHKQARRSDTDGGVGPTLTSSSSGSTKSTAAAKYEELALARPLAYYLGLLVGLAAYNEVHVDVPLPRCIYKTIKGEQVRPVQCNVRSQLNILSLFADCS